MDFVKIIAIATTALMIANLIALIFSRITPTLFWVITILCAIIAYKAIPYLRKSWK